MDIAKIIRLCNSYSNATGIEAFVINRNGIIIGAGNAPSPGCGFCRFIQKNPGRSDQCRRAHLYGSYQAERFGDVYVFFCPFGLVHWASPVLDEYQIIYSLIAGPVLMSTPENALISEILKKNGLNDDEIEVLHQESKRVKYMEPDKVNDTAALLFPLAAFLSTNISFNDLIEKQVHLEQQASIGAIIQEYKTDKKLQPIYPLEKEKDLVAKIRLGDKKGAQEVLNEIFGYIFFSKGNDLEQIKTRVIELVVLLSRAALEGGANCEEIFGLNSFYFKKIDNLQTIDEIAGWLSTVMLRFTDSVFNLQNVRNVDAIYKAVAFLQANYMNDISLEQVAEEVKLNPSYFSKLFKSEMKINFSLYLNKLRVENSKKNLLSESIPLVDVAGLAGFQDQSYYTKVFKKLVGISPGEFRKSRGRYNKESVLTGLNNRKQKDEL